MANVQCHQGLVLHCTALQAAKSARETSKPHTTQERETEDIAPLIEKGGTQETLWYIYIYYFFLTRAQVI